MRWIGRLLLVALAAPLAAQQPQQPTVEQLQVTLTDAVRRALQVQPAMVQARGDVRNAGAGMLAANGEFLPSLTTGGSWSRAGGTRLNSVNQIQTLPTNVTYTGSLSASFDLFTGFRRLADRRAASATRGAADAGLVNQRYQVTLQTQQAFYNALATEELVRVAQAQVARTRQELQISVDKLKAGSATRSDSLRSAVDVGNARLALLQAQANLEFAQASLGRQIGVDQPVRAAPDSALPTLPDTTGLRTQVVESSPQVVAADAQARAAGAQVAVSRSAYWPTLTYSASNSFTGADAPWDNTSAYSKGWNIRMSLSWTLFNGFQRERSLTSAAVARDEAQSRADDTRRAVNASLTQQVAALQTAFAQLDIARSNVAATTEDMRVQQERYRVGAATILDLLTSQANLTQAQVSLVQARFNYLIARATLEALVGHEL
jgi:outer membrane protein TolC